MPGVPPLPVLAPPVATPPVAVDFPPVDVVTPPVAVVTPPVADVFPPVTVVEPPFPGVAGTSLDASLGAVSAVVEAPPAPPVPGSVVLAPPPPPAAVVPPVPPVAGGVVAVDPPAPLVFGLLVPPVPRVWVLPPDPVTASEPVESQAAIKKLAAKRARNMPFGPEAFCPRWLSAFIASSADLNNCCPPVSILPDSYAVALDLGTAHYDRKRDGTATRQKQQAFQWAKGRQGAIGECDESESRTAAAKAR